MNNAKNNNSAEMYLIQIFFKVKIEEVLSLN